MVNVNKHQKYKVEVVCDGCGNSFRYNKYNLKHRKSSLCKKCLKDSTYKDYIGKTFNRLTIIGFGEPVIRNGYPKQTFKCLCSCGNELSISCTDVIRNHAKSCGCYKIDSQSSRWYGKNNPKWTGISDEERKEYEKIRQTIQYRKWRTSVLEREFYSCRCCGLDLELHVHHIKNLKDNEGLAFDIENGITLCRECHYSYHAFNGGNSNETNRESLEIWMKMTKESRGGI